MRDKGATVDAKVAAIAGRQHGVVVLSQLLEAGLSRKAISRRVSAGRLHRIHRGVYAVGHAGISPHGRWLAAARACGEGAVVSHRSAAVLWGLLKRDEEIVDVSITGIGGRKRRRGIRLHRSRSLRPCHITRRFVIPVTTPARTVADLRRAVSPRELRRAIREAEVRGLSLGTELEADRTRSDLERDFLRICRRYRLPAPEVNVEVGRYLVDFLWRERRLIVETDGYRYHRGRQAFRDDRARDLELRAMGCEVIRVSEEQVNLEPERVAGILREVLASRPHRVGADGS